MHHSNHHLLPHPPTHLWQMLTKLWIIIDADFQRSNNVFIRKQKRNNNHRIDYSCVWLQFGMFFFCFVPSFWNVMDLCLFGTVLCNILCLYRICVRVFVRSHKFWVLCVSNFLAYECEKINQCLETHTLTYTKQENSLA